MEKFLKWTAIVSVSIVVFLGGAYLGMVLVQGDISPLNKLVVLINK